MAISSSTLARTTANGLLKLVFRSNPCRPTIAPALNPRSLHTIDTKIPVNHDEDDETARHRGFHAKNNVFQATGPKGAYVTKESEEELYVRVDIPGVGVGDEIRVWVEKDSVFFEVKGSNGEHDGGRSYGGGFICCRDKYKLNEVQAKIKNGVLRMLIPKKKSDIINL